MNPKQTEELFKVIQILLAAYPSMAIKEETVQVYLTMLEDLPIPAVHQAVLHHIAENKWFPSVSELREIAIDNIPDRRVPSATEAWTEVERHTRAAASYEPNPYSHPAIEKAKDLVGGLWAIQKSEQPAIIRAQFYKIYEQLRKDAMSGTLQIPALKGGDDGRLLGAGKAEDSNERTEAKRGTGGVGENNLSRLRGLQEGGS